MNKQQGRKVLVTGAAGFIGGHLTERLLAAGDCVVALDNFNDFYDPAAKRANLSLFSKNPSFALVEGDLRDDQAMDAVFAHGPFDCVVHLAAMAGVRPSLQKPATLHGRQRKRQPEAH